MGRHRKNFDHGDLPARVYYHHSQYRFHPREGKRIPLGGDYGEAMRKWAELVRPAKELGTVSALLDWYLVNVAPNKSPRSFSDNKKEAEMLRKALGHIPYSQLRPHHVATYRDERGKTAPVRANREKALLSHAYSKAIEKGMVDHNPCKNVKRNPEKRRERLIDDREFQAVFACAEKSVQRMMTLIFRTAQRPEDLIQAGPANVKRISHEGREVRVLRIRQGKTGKTVDIILAGELEALVDEHLSAKMVWPTFVHTRAGKKYTYSGLVAMFSRYVRKQEIADFGMYDIKAMGATAMFRSGVPLERIMLLLGHASVTTTQIYIKARLPDVSMPNMCEMAGDERMPDALPGA